MRVFYMCFLLACGSSQSTTNQPNPLAAECVAHRTADQIACDDIFNTKAEIDACRVKVQLKIDCTDGGYLGLGWRDGGAE